MLILHRVRCDRNQPCQNCTRRGQAASCTFVDTPARKRAPQSSSSETRSMRQRVTQLEGMLRSFIEPSGSLASPRNYLETSSSQSTDDAGRKPPSDLDMKSGNTGLDESSPSPGKLTLDNSQTSYVSTAHWAAVLNEVSIMPVPRQFNSTSNANACYYDRLSTSKIV